MNLFDLYTVAALAMGTLIGAVVGYWLARMISSHTAERLERKVLSLSDNKFKLKGQRVRLKQLEQRLDAEAANIPLAERELQEKGGEIRELTAALNETTALTSELTQALRTRKLKVKQLQVEQAKWLKRNQALEMKRASLDEKLSGLQKDIAKGRDTNEALEKQPVASVATNQAANGAAKAPAAAPPAQNLLATSGKDGNVDRLTSRMQQMESELESWFDRLGKLEANVTGQHAQATGLAKLEEVLRGEADKQNAVANDDAPVLLGSRSVSSS